MGKNRKEMRSIRLTINFLRLLGMWPVKSRKEKLFSDSILVTVFLSMFFGFLVRVNDIYHLTGNLQGLVDAIPISAAAFAECLKLVVFIVYRQKVMSLNEFMNENFWQMKLNAEETKLFNKYDRVSFKAILAYVLSVQAVCWQYVLAPLGKLKYKRVLPYDMHYEIFLDTKYYGITYAMQVFATAGPCLCTTAFAVYMFTVNCFLANQFEILGIHLQSLGSYKLRANDEEQQLETYEKLKDCVQKHKILIEYAQEIESLFCYVMLGQAFGSIMQICCAGVQILLAKSFASVKIYASIVYLIGTSLQLSFYCYSSHKLLEQSESISTSMYFSDWPSMRNKKIRKDYARLVQMVILRGRRPCILTIGKLYPLTLGTFASICGTSMSFFMMLRQTIDR